MQKEYAEMWNGYVFKSSRPGGPGPAGQTQIHDHKIFMILHESGPKSLRKAFCLSLSPA